MPAGLRARVSRLGVLWTFSPRSDSTDRPAPAAQDLSVGLLVTALAHLHVRNLARRFDWAAFRFKSDALHMHGGDQLGGLLIPALQGRLKVYSPAALCGAGGAGGASGLARMR
jgi:hypothetical protein